MDGRDQRIGGRPGSHPEDECAEGRGERPAHSACPLWTMNTCRDELVFPRMSVAVTRSV